MAVQAWKKNGGDGQFLTGIQAERILVKEMRRRMEATRSEQGRHETKTTIRGNLKVRGGQYRGHQVRARTTQNKDDNWRPPVGQNNDDTKQGGQYRGHQARATTTKRKDDNLEAIASEQGRQL